VLLDDWGDGLAGLDGGFAGFEDVLEDGVLVLDVEVLGFGNEFLHGWGEDWSDVFADVDGLVEEIGEASFLSELHIDAAFSELVVSKLGGLLLGDWEESVLDEVTVSDWFNNVLNLVDNVLKFVEETGFLSELHVDAALVELLVDELGCLLLSDWEEGVLDEVAVGDWFNDILNLVDNVLKFVEET